MKSLKFAALLAVGLLPIAAHAVNICPTTVNTNSDCGFILTIGAGGSITGSAVAGANPYDGGDDALVGIINNSGSTFTGSIHLSGSGNGGGLFAFDTDGICSYASASYCSTAPTGYEGPINTFANINGTQTAGDVVVTGLADGATTYFSLESSPQSISTGGGIGVPPTANAPEPSSLVLLGTGVIGVAGSLRRRFLNA